MEGPNQLDPKVKEMPCACVYPLHLYLVSPPPATPHPLSPVQVLWMWTPYQSPSPWRHTSTPLLELSTTGTQPSTSTSLRTTHLHAPRAASALDPTFAQEQKALVLLHQDTLGQGVGARVVAVLLVVPRLLVLAVVLAAVVAWDPLLPTPAARNRTGRVWALVLVPAPPWGLGLGAPWLCLVARARDHPPTQAWMPLPRSTLVLLLPRQATVVVSAVSVAVVVVVVWGLVAFRWVLVLLHWEQWDPNVCLWPCE